MRGILQCSWGDLEHLNCIKTLLNNCVRRCSVIDNWNQESIESFYALLNRDCLWSIFRVPSFFFILRSRSWWEIPWERNDFNRTSSVWTQALNQFEFCFDTKIFWSQMSVTRFGFGLQSPPNKYGLISSASLNSKRR